MARNRTQRHEQALYAMDELEEAELFGRTTGECGLCGHALDAYEREVGICWPCQLENAEDYDGTR